MAFERLSRPEQRMILQCLISILEGPYVDEYEFQTRLGVERKELREVVAKWPDLDDTVEGSVTTLAINNCLNEVCYGVEIPPSEWITWFDSPKEDIEKTYVEWAKLKRYSSTGIR